MEPLRPTGAPNSLSDYTKWLDTQLGQKRRAASTLGEYSPTDDLSPFVLRDPGQFQLSCCPPDTPDEESDMNELSSNKTGDPRTVANKLGTFSPPNMASNPQNSSQPPGADVLDNFDFDQFLANQPTANSGGANTDTPAGASVFSRAVAGEALRQNGSYENPSGGPLFNNITISDDQTAGSERIERNLLALRDRDINLEPPPLAATMFPPTNNHALNDYQMQLMLLEQQNKKRLMMARQEQAQPMPGQNTNIPKGSMASPSISYVTSGPKTQNSQPNFGMMNMQYPPRPNNDPSGLNLETLQEYIQLLQSRVQQLESGHKESLPSRCQVLYRVVQKQKQANGRIEGDGQLSVPYFDVPQWIEGQQNQYQLRCSLPVVNFELYLERNKDIAFIVYRDYDPTRRDTAASINMERPIEGDDPLNECLINETIRPVAPALIEAIEILLSSRDEYSSILQGYKHLPELYAPYLPVYHSRKDFHNIQDGLSFEAQTQFSLFLQYVTDHYGDKYAAADSLFSNNMVSSDHIPYLFKPGDILVERRKDQYAAFMASSWPVKGESKHVTRLKNEVRDDDQSSTHDSHEVSKKVTSANVELQSWSITGWNWGFDGNFQRQTSMYIFDIEVSEETKRTVSKGKMSMAAKNQRTDLKRAKEQNITDMSIFPLTHARPELVSTLQKRGETFWKCRKRRLVSYVEKWMDKSQVTTEERYMIDLKTYTTLHRNKLLSIPLNDELGVDAMAKEEPPGDNFTYLLPAEIKGYNLRRKKWFDLEVDRISDVKWNVEAFESLVIERKARNLILALVSNQIAAERSTDLIAGKGNGLILLLHGGPGTGKTLTAESVAEIAQKPLYRVTCGDVGTKAEDVEKYLESVLHLGKIWGCVVLLDEADVFLEQRSLEDLQRNALVSVFLRVLEYYEGILVLTSNRVGTFDEAFKSRIQLALHYPSLGQYQRLRIWENFVRRLESFDDDKVDTRDLRNHLEDLSRERMNGRQIRNAITTARQYAEWQSGQSKNGKITKMTYEHLKDVIEVASRFDRYLDNLHGGYSQDQVAEYEGLRLAER